MRDYDFKLSEYESKSPSEEKGCRCSVAVGFLLVLLAIAIAVGVGIIVHFAGKPGDVNCNYNLEGLAVSDTNILQCAGLAAGNNRNICDACPSEITSMTYTTETGSPIPSSTPQTEDLSRLPSTFKPFLYEVFLQPDFYSQNTSDFRVTGNISILIHCNQDSARLILHARDMGVGQAITVTEENEADDIFGSFTLNAHYGTISITTRQPMLQGRNYTIAFQEFSYLLRTDFLGFFYTFYERNGKKVYLAHTDLETSETRRVFPCFDEPAFKAVFDITVARKPGRKALTNGQLDRTIQGADGWLYDVFKSSPLMSTYLLHIVVSDYEYTEATSANGVQMKFWTRPEAKTQTGFALDLSSRILTLFENYFNIPYPLEKMDSVAYTQYLWTAMENWGLIVYREDVFLFDEEKGSYLDKIYSALVISHEIAHNWFGNLVSPAWWDDLWLNEGFATYGEFLGADLAEPTWKMADYLSYESTGKALIKDGLKSSHPIYMAGVTDLGQILSYFDSITYKKGCSLIKMMEFFVGKETFRKGLENYLKSLSYGNAKHDDLWLAISKQAAHDNKAITNVKEIMDSWILQMNYPVVNIEWELEGRVRLTQKRYLENQNATDPGRFHSSYEYKWHIPFTYTTSMEKNFEKDENAIIMMDLQDNSFSVASDTIPPPAGHDWIIGNLKYLGYYLVNYDNRNWHALIDQLIAHHPVIGATNRVQIIHDSWALARSGELSLEIPFRLFDYIIYEDELSPWFAFADEIDTLHRLLFDHSVYGAFRKKMQAVIGMINITTSSQDITSSGVRDKQIYLACLFGIESCITQAKTAFHNSNVTKIDPTVSDTYYCTAVKHGGAEEWDAVYSRLKEENYYAERLRLLKALTCTRHQWLLAKMRDLMLNQNEVYANELWLVVKYMALNRDAAQFVWDFYQEHISTVMKRSGGYWGQQPILEIANNFNTPRRLLELKDFAKKSNLQGSQFFQQAMERAENNIKFVDTLTHAMQQWLNPTNPNVG